MGCGIVVDHRKQNTTTHMFQKHLLGFIAILYCFMVTAQRFDNRSWIYLSQTTKLFSKFSLLTEEQLRSEDQVKYVAATLLRVGLNYKLSEKHSIGAGYTYKGDREYNSQKGMYDYMNENRTYQQYQFDTKSGRTELQLRARLEQRFVRENGVRDFSQRTRLLLGAQIPIWANKDFSKGWYVVLQNEVFTNVQHPEKVNNNFFDQNRLYTSYGYRFSKHIDAELAYMLWTQKDEETEQRNVYQLKVTTDF